MNTLDHGLIDLFRRHLHCRLVGSEVTDLFLRMTAAIAVARLSHRYSLSVSLSVCHMGGSDKNGAS